MARVLVSEVDPARRDLLVQLGATVLDPAPRPRSRSRCRPELGGLADVTFDAVGLAPTVADALSSTRLGGAVCLVGMGTPRLELDAFAVSTMERSLVGSFTYSADDFRAAVDLVAGAPDGRDGPDQPGGVPDGAPDAFAALAAGDGTPGKVLVRLDND